MNSPQVETSTCLPSSSTQIQMDGLQPQDPGINLTTPVPSTPTKAVVTQTINLSREMNFFDWFQTTDIINQIAEKGKNSLWSVVTTLDPGMKEWLFSGGNINVVVLTDHQAHINPIRDAFLSVFGRATIGPCTLHVDYPVRVALGFKGALEVASQRIRRLRQDTSKFPQNQVVLVVQPSLINFNSTNQVIAAGDSQEASALATSNEKLENSNTHEPHEWFFTYVTILDDPVLGITLNSSSQLIPIDSETVDTLREEKFSEDRDCSHLGFPKTIDQVMNSELKLLPIEPDDQTEWLKVWAGLEDKNIIHDCVISLAYLYKRKWNNLVIK